MVLWILFDDNIAIVCNNGNLPLCKGAGQALPNVDQRAFKDKRIREMRKARCIHANIRGPKRHQNYTRTLDRKQVYIYVEYYFSEQMWRLCWDVLQLKVLIYIWARKPIGNNVASQSSSTSISFFLHVWHLSHHKTLSLSSKTPFFIIFREIFFGLEICQRNFVFHVLLYKLFVPKLVSEELLVL